MCSSFVFFFFVKEECVYCAVRSENLSIIQVKFSFQLVTENHENIQINAFLKSVLQHDPSVA